LALPPKNPMKTQALLFNSQSIDNLTVGAHTTAAMANSRVKDNAYWIYAVLLGSLVQLSLFAAMPWLAPKQKAAEAANPIEVEFLAWPTPQPSVNMAAKPVPKPRPKPKPEKIIAKAPPTPEAAEPAKPQPALDAQQIVDKELPKQDNRSEQPLEQPVEAPQTATDSTPQQQLPIPVAEFQITEYPSYVHEAPGIYPFQMRAQGREAVVGLDILIDKDGKVRDITVTQSQGELFDQAAVEKIRRSSFLPGKSDGQAVAVLLHEKVTFRLQ